MSTLDIKAVRKSFGPTEVLRGIDLTVPEGSTTAVVGASGCGKTTLLRIIAGFEAADRGSVVLDGTELTGDRGAVPAHRRGIGYVAQDGALFPHLNVQQNITFGLPWRRRRGRGRVDELLEMVSLGPEFADRRPEELSGGQQQRVALARALAREPRLMLLDEPFTALDAGLRASMRKSVAATLRKAGVTTVLVTHDQEEAMSFADQVAVMKSGLLTQVGPPRELYARPTDMFTAEFLGDVVVLAAEVSETAEGRRAQCVLGSVAVPPRCSVGAARIMLRPEQIVATQTTGPGAAVVEHSEFLGHDTMLRIKLENPEQRMAVRTVSVTAPSVGSAVDLHVLGEAVVLDA